MLPVFDPDRILAEPCIPSVCLQDKHFTSSSVYTLLASFPGSGNTWTRTIIEEGTRVYTGSMYSDQSLFRDGFLGELQDAFASSSSQHSAIKTHFPYIPTASGRVNAKTGAVVVVLRSPLDAILADFARRFGRGAHRHRTRVSADTLKAKFPAIFAEEAPRWRDFVQYWLGQGNTAAGMMNGAVVRRDHGVVSLEYSLALHGKAKKRGVPVLVLFYEDFVRRLPAATHRLMGFLFAALGTGGDGVAWDALVCTLTAGGRESQTKEKRPRRDDDFDVYNTNDDDDNNQTMRSLVQRACSEWWPSVWFEDVWGPCGGNGAAPPHNTSSSSPLHYLDEFRALQATCDDDV